MARELKCVSCRWGHCQQACHSAFTNREARSSTPACLHLGEHDEVVRRQQLDQGLFVQPCTAAPVGSLHSSTKAPRSAATSSLPTDAHAVGGSAASQEALLCPQHTKRADMCGRMVRWRTLEGGSVHEEEVGACICQHRGA